MLTKKILKEIRDEVYKDMMSEYSKANKLYESGEKDYHKYNRDMLESHFDYFNIRLNSVEEIEESIAMARKKYDIVKDLIGSSMPVQYISNDEDRDDESDIYVKWYAVIDKEALKPRMKGSLLNQVSEILFDYMKTKGYNGYNKRISCNVLKLFEDDKIGHDMLLELTYTDCSLFN